MVKIYSITKPISEFNAYFANGIDVSKYINLSDCTDFYPKGINSETLIYSDGKIIYSCCYTSAYGKYYITSVWSQQGCEYEYKVDYNKLERMLSC